MLIPDLLDFRVRALFPGPPPLESRPHRFRAYTLDDALDMCFVLSRHSFIRDADGAKWHYGLPQITPGDFCMIEGPEGEGLLYRCLEVGWEQVDPSSFPG